MKISLDFLFIVILTGLLYWHVTITEAQDERITELEAKVQVLVVADATQEKESEGNN